MDLYFPAGKAASTRSNQSPPITEAHNTSLAPPQPQPQAQQQQQPSSSMLPQHAHLNLFNILPHASNSNNNTASAASNPTLTSQQQQQQQQDVSIPFESNDFLEHHFDLHQQQQQQQQQQMQLPQPLSHSQLYQGQTSTSSAASTSAASAQQQQQQQAQTQQQLSPFSTKFGTSHPTATSAATVAAAASLGTLSRPPSLTSMTAFALPANHTLSRVGSFHNAFSGNFFPTAATYPAFPASGGGNTNGGSGSASQSQQQQTSPTPQQVNWAATATDFHFKSDSTTPVVGNAFAIFSQSPPPPPHPFLHHPQQQHSALSSSSSKSQQQQFIQSATKKTRSSSSKQMRMSSADDASYIPGPPPLDDDDDEDAPGSGGKSKLRSRNPSSTYRGVSKCSKDGRWQARIRVKRQVTYLGRFMREEDAARRYDEAAREHHGDKAVLNFLTPEDVHLGRKQAMGAGGQESGSPLIGVSPPPMDQHSHME